MNIDSLHLFPDIICQFCSLLFINFVHILIALYLNIHFFVSNVNGNIFLNSYSTCSLLIYRKTTVICILTLYLAVLL